MAVAKLLEPYDQNPLSEFHGSLRIRDTRVPMEAVVYAYREGASAEEIVAMYPSLQLPNVYATISLYLHRQDEFDAYVSRREADEVEQQAHIRELYPTKPLRTRLMKRWAALKHQEA